MRVYLYFRNYYRVYQWYAALSLFRKRVTALCDGNVHHLQVYLHCSDGYFYHRVQGPFVEQVPEMRY